MKINTSLTLLLSIIILYLVAGGNTLIYNQHNSYVLSISILSFIVLLALAFTMLTLNLRKQPYDAKSDKQGDKNNAESFVQMCPQEKNSSNGLRNFINVQKQVFPYNSSKAVSCKGLTTMLQDSSHTPGPWSREQIKNVLGLQLTELFTDLKYESPYRRALFAMFALCIAGKYQAYQVVRDRLSRAYEEDSMARKKYEPLSIVNRNNSVDFRIDPDQSKLDLSSYNQIMDIKKEYDVYDSRPGKWVQGFDLVCSDIVFWAYELIGVKEFQSLLLLKSKSHAWSETMLMSFLDGARKKNGLAAVEFGWLKAIDKPLFFALHAVGRPSYPPESLGAVAHWLAEIKEGKAITRRDVDQAVQKVVDLLGGELSDSGEEIPEENSFGENEFVGFNKVSMGLCDTFLDNLLKDEEIDGVSWREDRIDQEGSGLTLDRRIARLEAIVEKLLDQDGKHKGIV